MLSVFVCTSVSTFRLMKLVTVMHVHLVVFPVSIEVGDEGAATGLDTTGSGICKRQGTRNFDAHSTSRTLDKISGWSDPTLPKHGATASERATAGAH